MSKNRSNLNIAPEDILIPGLDHGLRLVRDESLDTGRIPPIKLDFLSLSPEIEHRISTYRAMWKNDTWIKSATFPTVLAVADSVSFSRGTMTIGGKFLLNSAPGARLRTRISQNNRELSEAISDHLTELSFSNTKAPEVYQGEWKDLDLVIEAKNFFNYYHFVKEALPNLTLYQQYDLQGKVVFCGVGSKISTFVHELCKTWFPSIYDRIEFRIGNDRPDYDRALIPFNTMHLYFQTRRQVMSPIEDVGARVPRRASPENFGTVANNSCEAPLLNLRETVRQALAPSTNEKRRLYVTRKSSRVRRVVGEEILISKLSRLGFECISFEDLSIREQAQTVSEAEMIVSIHGAGMTNMLFADPGCRVIELSNLQTLRKRFGDFNPLAIASGVHYCHVFLDHDFDDATIVPNISRDGHRGVVIDDFRAKVIASWIGHLLDPEQSESIRLKCSEINETRDFSALHHLLSKDADKIYHIPDTHVWLANCLNDMKMKDESLAPLRRALVLAPRRVPLQKRILDLASLLNDREGFEEARKHLRRFSEAEYVKLFKERGWPTEDIPDGQIAEKDAKISILRN
ncbi:glycosyltransferase family 61 protein [Paracoccus sp. MBLB3053]|uniref:Glycosyltransferase family 61 protein n=1 Tax=Paracoccus aurantius TaxID=3073814 RepID=A0ABU2HYC4_9RHOB|nr:glycosyltransferase family 61 protein [Paracoccus sp. MBLB3053]MDS9470062.1 glycosyltransferase family 61 protein [Paracoccus sp. MBLB3053]